MLQGETQIQNGTLRIAAILPIRGNYTLNVHVEPVQSDSRAFKSFSETHRLELNENPAKVRNGSLMFVGLILLGAVAGYFIGRGRRRGIVH
ncbi:hypothetical protein GCM10011571_20430 [Marinithermofilum abyssi]|uniref:Uncharacterized protein n=1 Tax=Marinithermofilum abyssi TaxID=1571185 RepID=A0A8J2VI81_9BACL|nr:hypothetical protein [Marinithermofilum abyssi]GGE18471.1 hypothetical protein GCM10011571_20430 [Marinithermofilum abyssi]